MEWISAALSDLGLVRVRNEDAFLRSDEGVFAVADGMGGHPAGHVASRIAVDAVRAGASGRDDGPGWLDEAFRAANGAIRERADQAPAEAGMGTTLCVLELDPAEHSARVAHVGDSRVYLWRDDSLRRLTRDDTALQDAIEAGRVQPEREAGHPLGSMLTLVLGLDDKVEAHMAQLEVRDDDLFLLCSDGICGVLDDAEIAGVLGEGDAPGELLTELTARVMARGAPDNATAVAVRILAD
ncbi:MAG: protein phosphatase 2C domain-containing protein [Gemmatimonadota bacterium]